MLKTILLSYSTDVIIFIIFLIFDFFFLLAMIDLGVANEHCRIS